MTGRIHFDDINLKKNYNVIKAYSQSKLANVLFTKELARPSKLSKDKDLAKRLYELSEEMVESGRI